MATTRQLLQLQSSPDATAKFALELEESVGKLLERIRILEERVDELHAAAARPPAKKAAAKKAAAAAEK